MFLRFAGVEWAAEGISHRYLQSKAFCEIVGTEGRKWFDVHVEDHPGGTTHELMAFRLAFTEDETLREKDRANPIIQEVVDMFIRASDDAYQTLKTP
jgi:hypothetical protein